MAFNTTGHLKNTVAKAMFDFLKLNFTSSYFFFAKTSKYGPGAGDTKLNLIPKKEQMAELHKELLLLYRMDKNTFTLCFDRINWTLNTIHTEYSQDNNEAKCYVITDEYRVYKCITNNEDSPSLYKPTHTTFDIKSYKDGYKWKFLYELSSLERRAFLSSTKIPISVYPIPNSYIDMVQFNAEAGTIDAVKIINGGSNYANTDVVKITGNGTGATGRVIAQGGILKRIEITSPGKGYTYANIEITGKGILAEVKAVISPFAGHGSDLMKELNVNSIMINSKTLNGTLDISNIPKSFDYRKIGLITDYKANKLDSTLISGCWKIRVEDSTNFTVNAQVKLNTITGIIAYKEIVLGEHYVYINETDVEATSLSITNKMMTQLNGTIESSTRIVEVIHKPNINKNFDILYLENLPKNTCVEHEIDILRIVLEF